jgi:hypothetical protein
MAKQAALLDYDQFVVKAITAYCGDSLVRTTCEFQTEYADGEIQWRVWDDDLCTCEAYTTFCKSVPQLWTLIYTTTIARKTQTLLNKQPITKPLPGEHIFVDLRAINAQWYNGIPPDGLQIPLSEEDTTTYVVE